jgi:NADH:ubiquinone oxidoreductase subunit 6 (subunit J)
MFTMIGITIALVILWQVTKRSIPALGAWSFYLAIVGALVVIATPVIIAIFRWGPTLFGNWLPHLIFWVLALLIIVCAFSVATRKNLVHAALFLCLTFVLIAGIFMLQNAEFIAAVQILIYAGAVTILMLFAIMLTQNLTGQELRAHNRQVPFVVLATLILATVMIYIFLRPVTVSDTLTFSAGQKWAVQASLEEMAVEVPNITLIGQSLMSTYTLAFWIVSIILTVAMIGSLILARKD